MNAPELYHFKHTLMLLVFLLLSSDSTTNCAEWRRYNMKQLCIRLYSLNKRNLQRLFLLNSALVRDVRLGQAAQGFACVCAPVDSLLLYSTINMIDLQNYV